MAAPRWRRPLWSLLRGHAAGRKRDRPAAPGAASGALADLVREIAATGSGDRAQLTAGGAGFLDGLALDAPLLVRTIAPTLASGGQAPAAPLVIQATGPVASDVAAA